jgi:SAM-dependent methyltransferase
MPRGLLAELRIALAERWPAFGEPGELRLRAAARRGEADMHADAAERLYAQLYLDAIRAALPPGRTLRVLDAGCQAGRLSIPLAADGHRLTGVDVDARWLDAARRHAAAAGLDIEFELGELSAVAARLPPASFEAVLCTEVLYTIREPAAALSALARLLPPEGLLFASHRTRHYMLATLARYRRLDDMLVVARAEEGEIFGGQYYNWYDQPSLERIYATAGLRIVECRGIGTVSGYGVDGMAGILDPGSLDEAGRERLAAIERLCAPRFPDAARYRLITAVPAEARHA